MAEQCNGVMVWQCKWCGGAMVWHAMVWQFNGVVVQWCGGGGVGSSGSAVAMGWWCVVLWS